MIIYISLFIGVLIFALDKLNRAWTLPDFSWKTFVKINGITIVINTLGAIYLSINQDEVVAIFQKLFPSWPFVSGGLFTGLLSIGAIYFIQFLVSIGHPKEKTAVGINSNI